MPEITDACKSSHLDIQKPMPLNSEDPVIKSQFYKSPDLNSANKAPSTPEVEPQRVDLDNEAHEVCQRNNTFLDFMPEITDACKSSHLDIEKSLNVDSDNETHEVCQGNNTFPHFMRSIFLPCLYAFGAGLLIYFIERAVSNNQCA